MLIRPIENSAAGNSFILPLTLQQNRASALTSEETKMNAQIVLFSFGYSVTKQEFVFLNIGNYTMQDMSLICLTRCFPSSPTIIYDTSPTIRKTSVSAMNPENVRDRDPLPQKLSCRAM